MKKTLQNRDKKNSQENQSKTLNLKINIHVFT